MSGVVWVFDTAVTREAEIPPCYFRAPGFRSQLCTSCQHPAGTDSEGWWDGPNSLVSGKQLGRPGLSSRLPALAWHLGNEPVELSSSAS